VKGRVIVKNIVKNACGFAFTFHLHFGTGMALLAF
jgi:hypothetical protein